VHNLPQDSYARSLNRSRLKGHVETSYADLTDTAGVYLVVKVIELSCKKKA